ncbi:MAG: M23 family metallopeptidase [Deltaproteobacteria bacterium]|nr:M23 family metallopeptidase [Deltaproteobacteria bacterium]
MGRIVLIVLLLLLAGSGVFGWIRGEGAAPVITAPEGVDLGRAAKVLEVRAEDAGSGVRSLRAVLRSAEGERELGAIDVAGGLLRGGAEPREAAALALTLDAKELGLKEGDAFLVVEARDWSLRGMLKGNAATLEIPVRVDLRPPRVAISNGITYLKRTGSGAVYYSVTDDAVSDGVEVGDRTYRGWPRKGGAPTDRIALFAIARDQGPDAGPRVIAEDRAGNRAAVGWSTDIKDAAFADTPIELGPNFMDAKIPELADELGYDRSDLVAAFQQINTEERAKNEARIREIVAKSGSERLFDGVFAPMRNAQVTSKFAEHRTYSYQGKQVSEAIHYGFDLASTAGAPIEAGNRGRVLFAGPLGIYGNTVILDHGLGLTSLYGHLAQIDVQEDQLIEKGARIGRSGKTGLAGGDHLHFAILVGSTYVDPVEWWDAKWVREKIDEVGGIAPEPAAESPAPAAAAAAAKS